MKNSKKPPDDLPPHWRPGHPEPPPKLPEAISPLLQPAKVYVPPEMVNGGVVPDLKPPSGATHQQARIVRELLIEKARREIEALRLYDPFPLAQEFHTSTAKFRIIRGSNRAGKTLASCAEVAMAVTGRHQNYPKTNGRCFIVGKDGKHLGQVLYRKLFRAGAFRIIRDALPPHKWRTFRPNDPADTARDKEAKLAPPLIPPRFIAPDGISWEDKRQSIPNLIRLRNGWEISFFPSGAKAPQGSDIDLVLFDEEVIDPDWLPEMTARLVDRNGRFIWSATPQAGTEQLWSLHEEAEAQADEPNPRHKEYVFLIADNPYLTPEQKKEFEESLGSDEERRVRVGGEFARLSYRVYPEFSLEKIHGVDFFDVPRTWTRYVAIDPGRQVCAALFAAVPPPDKGDYIYFYDELYIRNCNADLFGEHMAKKAQDQNFYAFLIDHQAARVTEMASGLTIEYQYMEALKRHKVRSHLTGHGFLWGATDVEAGVEAARSWLIIRPNGQGPKLKVLRNQLPHFKKEIERYPYKRDKAGIKDKPEDRGPVHLMACFRYLAMQRPRFVDFRPERLRRNPAALAFEKKQAKRKKAAEAEGESYIRLGPSSGYSGAFR